MPRTYKETALYIHKAALYTRKTALYLGVQALQIRTIKTALYIHKAAYPQKALFFVFLHRYVGLFCGYTHRYVGLFCGYLWVYKRALRIGARKQRTKPYIPLKHRALLITYSRALFVTNSRALLGCLLLHRIGLITNFHHEQQGFFRVILLRRIGAEALANEHTQKSPVVD